MLAPIQACAPSNHTASLCLWLFSRASISLHDYLDKDDALTQSGFAAAQSMKDKEIDILIQLNEEPCLPLPPLLSANTRIE